MLARRSARVFAAKIVPAQLSRSYASLTLNEYHHKADDTLESLLEAFENLAEKEPVVDAELAQGVLTIAMPPAGTYVLNKQPANQQIWLSSPISGPRRFEAASQTAPWLCCRDESTTLGAILRAEVRETFKQELELEDD